MSDSAQQLSEATASATPVLEGRPQGTSNEEQPAAEPSFDPAYEKRRQRILDHRAEAQDDPKYHAGLFGRGQLRPA